MDENRQRLEELYNERDWIESELIDLELQLDAIAAEIKQLESILDE